MKSSRKCRVNGSVEVRDRYTERDIWCPWKNITIPKWGSQKGQASFSSLWYCKMKLVYRNRICDWLLLRLVLEWPRTTARLGCKINPAIIGLFVHLAKQSFDMRGISKCCVSANWLNMWVFLWDHSKNDSLNVNEDSLYRIWVLHASINIRIRINAWTYASHHLWGDSNLGLISTLFYHLSE